MFNFFGRNKKNKILVYGNYMFASSGTNGQCTKTRNVFNYLSGFYGKELVDSFNIEGWKKRPITLFLKLSSAIRSYSCIVILPGGNNLGLILRLLKRRVMKKKIRCFYSVVGGWLPDYVASHKRAFLILKYFTGIYVETHVMETKLRDLGLANVFYSPVFSSRPPLPKDDVAKAICCSPHPVFRFCTFSRVCQSKGVGIAVEAIKNLNKNPQFSGKIHLDIFGILDPCFSSEFTQAIKNCPFIEYKGIIDDDKVLATLLEEDCMLFLTHYAGEGFPATLVESFSSALPVIASDWKANSEIIKDGVTGFVIKSDIGDYHSYLDTLSYLVSNPLIIGELRKNAYRQSDLFTAEKCMASLVSSIGPKESFFIKS